ncbi:hypothetical protein JM93_00951 [Roseibium hamelinense]|uniref:Uncharacterized protein n=1 Tax=Roseibium hamelinense TaxID=150831 RepID=A0A562TJ42_9HYPH|nr:hypothetical protein [Roseibium hamelinense]MTI42748.1 hypothetical protein [Roseibium hamelinense]TWI93394.1 hypothetical protein JM93_00951 [Roseibium hamelinense]
MWQRYFKPGGRLYVGALCVLTVLTAEAATFGLGLTTFVMLFPIVALISGIETILTKSAQQPALKGMVTLSLSIVFSAAVSAALCAGVLAAVWAQSIVFS